MSMSDKLKEKRSALLVEAQAIVDAAEAEARDLTSDEDGKIAQSLKDAASLDANIAHHEELEARSAQAKDRAV